MRRRTARAASGCTRPAATSCATCWRCRRRTSARRRGRWRSAAARSTPGMRITWLMRATLHLVHADDLAWLHPLFAPRMEATNVRRLKQLGVTGRCRSRRRADRGARAGDARRAEGAPRRTRHPGRGPGDRPPARARGDAGPRRADADRVFVAAVAARVVRSRGRAGRARPPLRRVPRRGDRATTSRTGPGCRSATAASRGPCAVEDGPVPRVSLPAYDELLLGWNDRSPTVPRELAPSHVHPGGGIIRAVTLVDGVVTP